FKTEFPRLLETLQDQDVETNGVILTFDKGTISEDLFKHVDASDIKWVCSTRPSSYKDLVKLVPADFQFDILPSKKLLGIYETRHFFHGKKRRLLVIYNPLQQHWNAKNLTKKLLKRMDELKEFFGNRLNVKKWRDKDNVIKKIEKKMTKKYLQFVEYKVGGEYGQLSWQIKLKELTLKRHQATLGKTFLVTNLDKSSSSAFDVAWIYRQQFTIERAFSYVKNYNPQGHLKVQPIYAHTDESIRGHLFSCVLALMLMMLLQRELNQKIEGISLRKMIDLLSEIQVAEVKFRGSSKIKRQLVNISDDAKEICDLLKLEEIL
ncbi:MAG: IS1634 family transposase, partial [Candidatus Heimdallarchaeota archaeon]